MLTRPSDARRWIKLETRVRRYKRRLKNHHTHPGGRAATAEMASLIVLRADDEGDFDAKRGRTARGMPPAPPAAMIIAETEATLEDHARSPWR